MVATMKGELQGLLEKIAALDYQEGGRLDSLRLELLVDVMCKLDRAERKNPQWT